MNRARVLAGIGAACIAASLTLPIAEPAEPFGTRHERSHPQSLGDLASPAEQSLPRSYALYWPGLMSPWTARAFVAFGCAAIALTVFLPRRALWIPGTAWGLASLGGAGYILWATEIADVDGFIWIKRSGELIDSYLGFAFQIAPWGWAAALLGALLILVGWWTARRQPAD